MRRASLIALLLASGPAFGRDPGRSTAGQVLEEIPAWRTEEGRKAVWRDVAKWAIDNGLPDEALAMVARLHEVGEHSPELDVIQARALHAQGLPAEARTKLEQIVDRTPRNVDAWRALGVVLADMGEPEPAVTALQRALKLQDGDVATRNNLGFLLMALGRCPEAVEHLALCVSQDGTQPRYRNNLASALVCNGEPERALQLFRSTGTELDALYNLGVAHERAGQLDQARASYEQALALDPDYPSAKDALARLESDPTDPEGASP